MGVTNISDIGPPILSGMTNGGVGLSLLEQEIEKVIITAITRNRDIRRIFVEIKA